jgi:hypothetical protein
MEIALIPPQSVRIKGKQASFVINPIGKVSGVNGIFVFGKEPIDMSKVEEETIVLQGPGEYELGGVKISGIRVAGQTAYSMRIDNIELLFGDIEAIQKDYAKLKEYHIVLLMTNTIADASFVTSFAPNAVIFFGEKAEETIKQLAKEAYKKESKYVTTVDKLPQEMEAILLA